MKAQASSHSSFIIPHSSFPVRPPSRSGFRPLFTIRALDKLQTDVVVRHAHDGLAARLESPEQNLLGARRTDLLLYEAGHRARAHLLAVAVLGEPAARALREREFDVLLDELRAHFRDELVHDALDGLERERRERDPGVEAVAELRAEGALDGAAALPLREAGLVFLKTYLRVGHLARAGVGGHDEDDVV